ATSLSWTPAEGLSNPNIGNPLVETTRDAVYILRAEGMNGCYDLDTVQINIFPRLGLNAGKDTTVIESQTVVIVTTGGPYLSYQWEPATGVDDPTSPSPEIGILQTTTYIVSAETDQGCTDRDTITIKLAERLIVYNAFSPNDDGVNDYWDIDYAWFYPDITVEVFNRWGERLFSTKGYTDDRRWNGKYKGTDVPLGTYYYVIVPYPGASALTGPVTVVR
ncbi:MAG: gliding motility-associated C-terminal domain-containing protein, partial [Bacteroidales bacterium]|nr:gliding motility-associated C-terminal domain-containing protein [Bacteroidales bacterium]